MGWWRDVRPLLFTGIAFALPAAIAFVAYQVILRSPPTLALIRAKVPGWWPAAARRLDPRSGYGTASKQVSRASGSNLQAPAPAAVAVFHGRSVETW